MSCADKSAIYNAIADKITQVQIVRRKQKQSITQQFFYNQITAKN